MKVSDYLSAVNSEPTTKFHISKNPAIEIKQVQEFEEKLKVKLPNDLVEFYNYSNGLEGDDFIFNIIPLQEVTVDKDEIGIYLVFAEYMIYSETCGVEIDKADVNKYRFFNTSVYPIKNNRIHRFYIADSLEDFIKLYCREGTFGIWTDYNENNDSET